MKFLQYLNLSIQLTHLKKKLGKIKDLEKILKELEKELLQKTNENTCMLFEFNKIIKERDNYKYQLEKSQKNNYINQKDHYIKQLENINEILRLKIKLKELRNFLNIPQISNIQNPYTLYISPYM